MHIVKSNYSKQRLFHNVFQNTCRFQNIKVKIVLKIPNYVIVKKKIVVFYTNMAQIDIFFAIQDLKTKFTKNGAIFSGPDELLGKTTKVKFRTRTTSMDITLCCVKIGRL